MVRDFRYVHFNSLALASFVLAMFSSLSLVHQAVALGSSERRTLPQVAGDRRLYEMGSRSSQIGMDCTSARA